MREAAEITAAAENGTPMMVSYVDRRGRSYRRRARPLSARSVNMHIDLLAQILAVAVDQRPYPEQIAIVLEAARELDRGDTVLDVQDRHGRTWKQRQPLQTTGRRAAIATLLLGGGRASATGAMVWRDVDLANGRFEVGRDKTDVGMREVDMLPLLREILTEHKAASARTGPAPRARPSAPSNSRHATPSAGVPSRAHRDDRRPRLSPAALRDNAEQVAARARATRVGVMRVCRSAPSTTAFAFPSRLEPAIESATTQASFSVR